MILRATVRSKHSDDFVRTIDVNEAKDFDRIGAAAATWARVKAKSMQLYGHEVRHELALHMTWVPDPPPANGNQPPAAKGRRAHAKRRK